eukprot:TRINITY_DN1820_c0_g2_i2.p1 TRINITY_DN1820_c0_g2~~TRINITY_DN1820_c0_g2_i2.p1  ORF type:complete len:808 (-),score=207.87 TRINITY_DN1820_c0_g2_i2:275-2698(-)
MLRLERMRENAVVHEEYKKAQELKEQIAQLLQAASAPHSAPPMIRRTSPPTQRRRTPVQEEQPLTSPTLRDATVHASSPPPKRASQPSAAAAPAPYAQRRGSKPKAAQSSPQPIIMKHSASIEHLPESHNESVPILTVPVARAEEEVSVTPSSVAGDLMREERKRLQKQAEQAAKTATKPDIHLTVLNKGPMNVTTLSKRRRPVSTPPTLHRQDTDAHLMRTYSMWNIQFEHGSDLVELFGQDVHDMCLSRKSSERLHGLQALTSALSRMHNFEPRVLHAVIDVVELAMQSKQQRVFFAALDLVQVAFGHFAINHTDSGIKTCALRVILSAASRLGDNNDNIQGASARTFEFFARCKNIGGCANVFEQMMSLEATTPPELASMLAVVHALTQQFGVDETTGVRLGPAMKLVIRGLEHESPVCRDVASSLARLLYRCEGQTVKMMIQKSQLQRATIQNMLLRTLLDELAGTELFTADEKVYPVLPPPGRISHKPLELLHPELVVVTSPRDDDDSTDSMPYDGGVDDDTDFSDNDELTYIRAPDNFAVERYYRGNTPIEDEPTYDMLISQLASRNVDPVSNVAAAAKGIQKGPVSSLVQPLGRGGGGTSPTGNMQSSIVLRARNSLRYNLLRSSSGKFLLASSGGAEAYASVQPHVEQQHQHPNELSVTSLTLAAASAPHPYHGPDSEMLAAQPNSSPALILMSKGRRPAADSLLPFPPSSALSSSTDASSQQTEIHSGPSSAASLPTNSHGQTTTSGSTIPTDSTGSTPTPTAPDDHPVPENVMSGKSSLLPPKRTQPQPASKACVLL